MNETANDTAAAATAQAAETQAARPPRRWPWAFLLGAALLAAGAAAGRWGWQRLAALEQRLARLEETARGLDQRGAIQALQARLDHLSAEWQGELEAQRAALAALQRRLAGLEEALGRDETAWRLAEVRHLVHIAHWQLTLLHDPDGALRALRAADAILARLPDTEVLTLRQRLAADIAALQTAPRPDETGAALRLLALANRLHDLPAPRRPRVAAASPGDADLWARALRWLGVRSAQAPAATAALRSELFYVEQLLQLALARAREALLRYDLDGYRRHLAEAQRLLAEHYDGGDRRVAAVAVELNELAQASLKIDWPDLGATLRLLDGRAAPGDRP